MKAIYLFFFLLCITLSLPTWAQFGFRLGANLSRVEVEVQNSPVSIEADSKLGLQVGLFYEGSLGERFTFQPEVLFFQKGYKSELGNDDFKSTFNYLEVPLIAKYNFGGTKTNPFLLAGPAVGIGLSVKARLGDRSESLSLDEANLNTLDFGLNLGGGIAFPSEQGTFFLDIRYLLGLANIEREGNNDSNNRGVSFSLGYRF